MAEAFGLDQIFRRALEANARYYEALGQVTTDYLKALAGVVGEFRLPSQLGGRAAGLGAARPVAAPPAPVAPTDPVKAASAMVLEGVAGQEAVGAFMVQNHFSQKVAAPVVVSAFLDPSGAELRPALAFEPDVVALEAGEQVLVRVTASIDERLRPGIAYRGEVAVPGLSGDRVPLVLRRRVAASEGAKAPGTRAKAAPKAAHRPRGKSRGRRVARPH